MTTFLETVETKFYKYFEIARISYQTRVTYLVDLLVRNLRIIFRIWIFTQLYTVTYATVGEVVINGLAVPQIIWGLMFAQSFQAASSRPTVAKFIDEEIKLGTLAYSANRPYSYIFFHYCNYLGRIVSYHTFNIPLGIIAALALVGPIEFSFLSLLGGLVLIFFGFLLNFFISFTIGLSAFWLEDISAVKWIYSKAVYVFGGVILPLSLFPEQLRYFVELLPFSQIYYAASRILIQFDSHLFIQYLLTQSFWILFFGLVTSLIYRKGMKHVSINGG